VLEEGRMGKEREVLKREKERKGGEEKRWVKGREE
jgi:hypothetical protein